MPRIEIELQDGIKHQVDFDQMPTDNDIDEVAKHLSSIQPSIAQNSVGTFKNNYSTFDAVNNGAYEPRDIGLPSFNSGLSQPQIQQSQVQPQQVQQPYQHQIDAYNQQVVKQRQKQALLNQYKQQQAINNVSQQVNDIHNNSMFNQVVDSMHQPSIAFDNSLANTPLGSEPNVDGALQAYVSATPDKEPGLFDRAKNWVGRQINAIKNIPQHAGKTIMSTLLGIPLGIYEAASAPRTSFAANNASWKNVKDIHDFYMQNKDYQDIYNSLRKTVNPNIPDLSVQIMALSKLNKILDGRGDVFQNYQNYVKNQRDKDARVYYQQRDKHINDALKPLGYEGDSRSAGIGKTIGTIGAWAAGGKGYAPITHQANVVKNSILNKAPIISAADKFNKSNFGQFVNTVNNGLKNVANKVGDIPLPLIAKDVDGKIVSKIPLVDDPTVHGLVGTIHNSGKTLANFSMYGRLLQDAAGVTPDVSIPEQYGTAYVQGLPFAAVHLPTKAAGLGIRKAQEKIKAQKEKEQQKGSHIETKEFVDDNGTLVTHIFNKSLQEPTTPVEPPAQQTTPNKQQTPQNEPSSMPKSNPQPTRQQAEENAKRNGDVDTTLPKQEIGKTEEVPNTETAVSDISEQQVIKRGGKTRAQMQANFDKNTGKVTKLPSGTAEGVDTLQRNTGGKDTTYDNVVEDSMTYSLDDDIDYNDKFWKNLKSKYSVRKNDGVLVYKYGQKNAGKPVPKEELSQLRKDIRGYFDSKRQHSPSQEQIRDIEEYTNDDGTMHYEDIGNTNSYNENAAKYSDKLTVEDTDSKISQRYVSENPKFIKFWDNNFVNGKDVKDVGSNVSQEVRRIFEAKDSKEEAIKDVIDFSNDYLNQLDREVNFGKSRKAGDQDYVSPKVEEAYERHLVNALEDIGLDSNEIYQALKSIDKEYITSTFTEKKKQQTRDFISKNIFGKNSPFSKLYGFIDSFKTVYHNIPIFKNGKSTKKEFKPISYTEEQLIDELAKRVPKDNAQEFYDDFIKRLDSHVWFTEGSSDHDRFIDLNKKNYANELVKKAIEKTGQKVTYTDIPTYKEHRDEGISLLKKFLDKEYDDSDMSKVLPSDYKPKIDNNGEPIFPTELELGAHTIEKYGLKSAYLKADQKPILNEHYMRSADKQNKDLNEMLGLSFYRTNKDGKDIYTVSDTPNIDKIIANGKAKGQLTDKSTQKDIDNYLEYVAKQAQDKLNKFKNVIFNDIAYSGNSKERMQYVAGTHIGDTHIDGGVKGTGDSWGTEHIDYHKNKAQKRIDTLQNAIDTLKSFNKKRVADKISVYDEDINAEVDKYFNDNGDNAILQWAKAGISKSVGHEKTTETIIDKRGHRRKVTKNKRNSDGVLYTKITKEITDRTLALASAKYNYKKSNKSAIENRLKNQYAENGWGSDRIQRLKERNARLDENSKKPLDHEDTETAELFIKCASNDKNRHLTYGLVGKQTTMRHVVDTLYKEGKMSKQEYNYYSSFGNTPIKFVDPSDSLSYFDRKTGTIHLRASDDISVLNHEFRHNEQNIYSKQNSDFNDNIYSDNSKFTAAYIRKGLITKTIKFKGSSIDVNLSRLLSAYRRLENNDVTGYNKDILQFAREIQSKHTGKPVGRVSPELTTALRRLSQSVVRDAYRDYRLHFTEIDANMVRKNLYPRNVSVAEVHKAWKTCEQQIKDIIERKTNETVTEREKAIQRILRKQLSTPNVNDGGVGNVQREPRNISSKIDKSIERDIRGELGETGIYGRQLGLDKDIEIDEFDDDINSGRQSLSSNKADVSKDKKLKLSDRIENAALDRRNALNLAEFRANTNIAEFNNALNDVVGDTIDASMARKIIPFIREGKQNPKFPKSNPEYKKAYSLLSTDQRKQIRKLANGLYNNLSSYWSEYSNKTGVKSSVDDATYVPHVFKGATPEDQAILDQYYNKDPDVKPIRNLNANSKFAKHRVNETLADVIDNGLVVNVRVGEHPNGKPKFKPTTIKVDPELDYSKLMSDHTMNLAKASADLDFLKLGSTKLGDGTYIKDTNEFQHTYKRITKVERERTPIGKAYDTANAFVKHSKFIGSLVHAKTLTESGVSVDIGKAAKISFNPVKMIEDIKSGNFDIIKKRESAEYAVSNGMQWGSLSDAQVKEMQNAFSWLIDKTQGKGNVGNSIAKITKTLKSADDLNNRYLWEYLHNSLKLMAFETHCELYKKAYKTDTIPKDVAQEIAQISNDLFGGQIWENLHITEGGQKWFQRTVLSPDWTISAMIREPLSALSSGTLQRGLNWGAKHLGKPGHATREAARRLGIAAINNSPDAASFRGKIGRRYLARNVLLVGQILGRFGTYAALTLDGLINPDEYDKFSDVYKSHKFSDGDESNLEKFTNELYPDLYLGRNKDGVMQYARVGKQGREMLELFENGRYSIYNRASQKASPLLSAPLTEFSVSQANKSNNSHIQNKYGWQNNSKVKDKETGEIKTRSIPKRLALNTLNQSKPLAISKDYLAENFIGNPSTKDTNFYSAVNEAKSKIIKGELSKDSHDFARRVMDNNLHSYDKDIISEGVVANAAEGLFRQYQDNPEMMQNIEAQLRDYGLSEKTILKAKRYGSISENEASKLKRYYQKKYYSK